MNSQALNPKIFLRLLKQTFTEWSEDKAPRLAAALAFYTVISLAPLLLIAITIAGLVFGQQAAQGQIVEQLQGLVGKDIAATIQTMLKGSNQPAVSNLASVISIATLVFGASGVFAQLQDALNTIWGVAPKPGRGVKGVIKVRFLSFAMVLVIGFLLLVSLALSAGLAILGAFLSALVPGLITLWQVVNFLISFAVIALLFAALYKVLPDVKIAWSEVWLGATITALLFELGKFLLGLYFSRSTISSTYGAAGSFVILLLWAFYSAQILLFGAEFTQVYFKQSGSRIIPSEDAVTITPQARAQQGIPHTEELKAMTQAQEEQVTKPSSNEQVTDRLLSSTQRQNQRTSRHRPSVLFIFLAGLVQGVGWLKGLKGRKNINRQNRR